MESFPSSNQLLCLVGEAFDDYSDDVCGAVVNIRNKGDKIAVWTSDYENREAVTHIGWGGPPHWACADLFPRRLRFLSHRRVYKERLGLPMKMTIGYQSHADTATKSGSTTKNKFVVWEKCLMCLFSFSLSYLLVFTLLQRLCETQSGGGGGKSNLHAKITRTGPSAAAMTLTERHRETQSCTLIS